MSFGIKAVQNGVTLAAGTSTHPAPITVAVGDLLYLSFTGTSSSYDWSETVVPAGSHTVISSRTSPAPTVIVDLDGEGYTFQLVDDALNVYTLDVVTPSETSTVTPTGVVTYVTNIASLRTFSGGASNATAIVRCYSVAGDGGGGIFIWRIVDATNLLPSDDNGLNILVAAVTSGWWERQYSGIIDPRWFGAKADDGVAVTDAVLTSGSAVMTSASASFSAADIGKLVAVECAWSAATGTVSTVSASAATGTFTATALSPYIVGAGTSWLTQLFVGMQLRCTGAWGAGVTVTVVKITDDTHAIVNFRASFTASGLTLSRYYMTGAGTSFTTELTEGQGVIISGTQYWVGPIDSNTRCGLLKSYSGGTVVSSSASGLTLYRKTVFEANILTVNSAHSVNLDANAPANASGAMAFWATNSYTAWVSALAVLPTSLHLVGEQCVKGGALDPGNWPLRVEGEGWSQLSGQNGFMSASLSCTQPIDGSVLRVFGGYDGFKTSATSYRKLQLRHMAIIGTGRLGTKGVYPTGGDPACNSNENVFDNTCVFNFEDGWRLVNSLESRAFVPFSAMSCINGINVYDAVTNSQISVKAEGNYRNLYVQSGTGITFSGTIQDAFYGIALCPLIAGLDEIIFKEMHVEGNQDSWLINVPAFGVSRMMLGDGFHDFSENTFYVRTTGFAILAKLDIGGASKVPYYWIAPAFNNRWNLSGDGYLSVDAGAAAIKLSDYNGVYETAGIGETLINNAGVVTVDWTLGNPHSITLVANITDLQLPTKAPLGAYVTFKFKQDGSGERTVVFNAGYKGDIRVDPLGQRVTVMTFYQESAGVWQKCYGTGNSCNTIRTGNDGAWTMHNSTGTEANVLRAGGDGAIQLGDDTAVTGTTIAVKARGSITDTIDGVAVRVEAASYVQYNKIRYGLKNALAATTSTMSELTNQTPAANGTQQWSPSLDLVGQGWHTGGTPSSVECRWQMYCVPIQSAGATLPDMEWRLQGLIGSGIGTSPLRVRMDNDGTLKWAFNNVAPTATQTGYSVTNPTTDRALNVTGDTLAQGLQVLGTLIADLIAKGVISA